MIISSIKIGGRIYTGEGITIIDAIQSLVVGGARGTGVLTIKKGDIVKEKIIPAITVMRLFGKGSPTVKEVLLKKVSELFDHNLLE